MKLIDADRLMPRCMFRGRCDSGGGSRCDKCTDYAVQYQDIEDAPIVSPECKTGRWIQLTCDSAEWWYCSECNGRVQMNPWAKYNYCPNCGADMRSEQNE